MSKEEKDALIQEEIDRVTMALIKKPHKMEEIFKTSFLTTEEQFEALKWAFRLRDKIDTLLETGSRRVKTENRMANALYTEIEALMQNEWIQEEQKKELKKTLFLLRSNVYEKYSDLLIQNLKTLLHLTQRESNYLYKSPKTYKLYILNQLIRGGIFGWFLGYTIFTLFLK